MHTMSSTGNQLPEQADEGQRPVQSANDLSPPDHPPTDRPPSNQPSSNQPPASQFTHSKSLIHRRPHNLVNDQLYQHHRLHHHKLNQKCNHHYQCVVYANLLRNQQFKKDHKKKKSKRKFSKRARRRKKQTFREPPDGGYGWLIVFASFLISLIADGISFSFGMIFVELIKFFKESKSKTAVVGSLFFAMPLLAGPIASALTDRYGCRIVTIASGIIAASGFFISSFVGSIELLYLTFSLTGIGLSLCYVSGIVVIAHYFEKRRSLATGLAVCGTGIGTFVFPPLVNYFLNTYQWQRTLIIISCFFLVIMVCGFLIKDLNLEETEIESEKNNEKKKSAKERKKKVRLVEECSDVSNKLGYEDSFYKSDSTAKSENVHLLNGSDVKSNPEKSQAKVSNQTSLLTSSSEDSYSLSSSSSSSSESKSSSTSDLRTTNDLSFNEKLSIQFDKFDNILYSKCENDDDDVFEPNLLTSCNDLSANFNGLVRSNSTICLPTYLPEMYGTLKTGKEIAHGNQSTTTTPKLKSASDQADQLTSSQFHKDILLNLQKKFYFYKLINVYPYLFPECCRQQQCDCCADQIDQLNQTVHSEKEFYKKGKKSYATSYKPPCIHSLSNVCDYDISYADQPTYGGKNDGKEQQSAGKMVEFKLASDPNNNYDDSKLESLSPTSVSTITTSTGATIPPANPKIAQLKPLSNKNVGQSLINSFVQLEPANYFRHMKLKRDSISYRSAMLNISRYRLKASSCPDIYRNSLLSLHRDHSKYNLFLTLKYFICDIFDMSLLRDCRFALFCISNSFLYACIDIPYIYLPVYATQRGVSEEMASYLISVIGIVNTLGIVIVGYIGDKAWIKTTNLYSLFTTISGFSIFFLPLLQNYAGFVVAAAVYGFSISVNYTLITVILVDILSIERFTNGYGFLLLVQGCSTLIGPPLAGWLFDISGSYNTTFYITGLCIIFSGGIVLPIDNRAKCWSLLKRYRPKSINDSFNDKKSTNGLNYSLENCLNQDKEKFTNLLNA